MFSSLTCLHSGQTVPVIGCSYHNSINILVVQYHTVIHGDIGYGITLLSKLLNFIFQHLAIHIAESMAFHIALLENVLKIVPSHIAGTYEGHVDSVIGSWYPGW